MYVIRLVAAAVAALEILVESSVNPFFSAFATMTRGICSVMITQSNWDRSSYLEEKGNGEKDVLSVCSKWCTQDVGRFTVHMRVDRLHLISWYYMVGFSEIDCINSIQLDCKVKVKVEARLILVCYCTNT